MPALGGPAGVIPAEAAGAARSTSNADGLSAPRGAPRHDDPLVPSPLPACAPVADTGAPSLSPLSSD